MAATVHNSSMDTVPPQHQFSDYVEITLLSLMVLIGCPLNILALIRSMKRYERNDERSKSQSSNSKDRPVRRFSRTLVKSFNNGRSSRVFALILHLTVANLMILLIYGCSQIGWLITYSWNGGEFVCKFLKFLHAMCFYGTSNLMVTIAIERLYIAVNLYRPRSWGGTSGRSECMRMMPWIGWVLAFLGSMPQWFIWRVISPYPQTQPDWHQCVDIWILDKTHDQYEKSRAEKIYVGVHLTLVFWLPIFVIAFCYALIIARLDSKLRKSYRESRRWKKQSDAAEFRQRAERWHRASCNLSRSENTTENGRRESVVLLMEMPIVVESPRLLSPAPPEKRATLNETGAILITTLTRARRSAVTKMTCVLLAYVLCWTPYNVMALWRYGDPNKYGESGMEYLYNFIVLNAVINPLLYGC